MVSTGTKRGLVLVTVGLLLTVTLFGATLAVGADRTVLDGEFVNDAAADQDVADAASDELADRFANEADDERLDELDRPAEEIVADALEQGDLDAQLSTTIDDLYAVLHGERDELTIAIDTVEIKDALEAEVEDDVRNGTVVQDQLPEIRDTDVSGMTESQTEYETTRAEFQDNYPIPPGNEEEAEREINAELEAELEEEVENETQREAMLDYGAVYVEALVYDEVTYEQFSAAEEAEREQVADVLTDQFRAELDEEIEDSYVFVEDDDDAVEALQQAQTPVSIVTTLATVLPLLSIGLAAVIGRVAPSRSSALYQVGAIASVVGLATWGGVRFAEGALEDAIRAELDDTPSIADLLVALVSETMGVFASQSQLLAGLGVACLVGGYAVRHGHAPIPDVPGDGDAETVATTERTDSDTQPADADDEVVTYDEDERLEDEADDPSVEHEDDGVDAEPDAPTDAADESSAAEGDESAAETDESAAETDEPAAGTDESAGEDDDSSADDAQPVEVRHDDGAESSTTPEASDADTASDAENSAAPDASDADTASDAESRDAE